MMEVLNIPRLTGRQKTPWLVLSLSIAACALLMPSFSLPSDFVAEVSSSITVPGNANQLARTVIDNEIIQQDRDHALWSYRLTVRQDGALRTYMACQTRDGEVRRLVAINGTPLSAARQSAEDKRVESLARHPDRIRESHRKEQEDAAKTHKLMKTLPDAFLFSYEEPQPSPTDASPLVRLRFRPNPKFHPSGEAETVFHHMEGEMTVDARQNRLQEIRGKLTSEVKFLGGMLGHLDPGGTFQVVQKDLGKGLWEIVNLDVQMDGKALFFKTIAVRQKESYSDFQSLPPQTQPQQAVAMLMANRSVAQISP